jgi:hypothetical protein
MASTTLLLPEPLGPTTQVMPGSKRSVVADAKDLKPARRGRGWQRGQVNADRFMNRSRLTAAPQRGHGRPCWP